MMKQQSSADADKALEMEFQSDPQMLSVIRATAERFAEMVGFSEGEQRCIVRALDEALSNIIRHCYSGRTDQPIAVRFRPLPVELGKKGGLEIVLTDEGPPMDFSKLHGRELNDVRPGGLGLHFIRQAMDTVDFSRSDGRNHLRLVKYMGGKPGEGNSVCG
jgi:serine/threonine-protein kinase RsbW